MIIHRMPILVMISHYTPRLPNAFAALLMALMVCSSLLSAQQPAPTLEVLPASTEFPPVGVTRVMLVLRNPTADSLADIRIAPTTNLAVKITGAPALDGSHGLPPNGEIAWRIEIADSALDVTTGSIMFSAGFTKIAKATAERSPRVLVQTLAIKRKEIAELVEMKIESTLDAIDDNRPGIIYLLITNKSSTTVRVAGITPNVPDFITIDSASIDSVLRTATFPPHETGVLPIPIKTDSRVQPGKHLLLFTVKLAWKDHGEIGSRNIIVSRNVTVAVYGESALLSILAIPSILLMPGILILVVWNLLWTKKLFRKKGDTTPFFVTLDPDKSKLELGITTAVVSTTISMLVVAFYIWRIRNILTAYGLIDLVSLWLFSVIGIGVGCYLLFSFLRWLRHQRAHVRWDDALTTLKKMGRRNASIRRDVRNLTLDGKEGDVFLLEEMREGKEEIWVSPQIVVIKKIGSDGEPEISLEGGSSIDGAVEHGSARELAEQIAEHASSLLVQFVRGGVIDGPVKVPVTSLSQDVTKDDLVRLE